MVEKKKILIIGCSNGLGLHYVFRDTFKKNKTLNFKVEQSAVGPSGFDDYDEIASDDLVEFYNLSLSGSGNTYISNRCIEFLTENPTTDYVYIQFSGLQRVDLPLTKDELGINSKEYRIRHSKYYSWMPSGGYTGSWLNYEFTRKLFSNFYSKDNALNLHFINLLEIYKCISFLKQLKIKFNWSTYYDYLLAPSSNSSKDGVIEKESKSYQIYNMLNKENFVEPPLSFIIKNGFKTQTDQVHYPYESQMEWLKSIKNKIELPDIG